MNWPRWNLSDLAMVIAGLALSFALFGVEQTAIGFVILVPPVLVPPSWPLTISAWVVAIGPPALLVLVHYVTWGVLWHKEGARPTMISTPYLVNVHNTPEVRVLVAALNVAELAIFWSLPLSIAIAWVRIIRFWKGGLPIWVGARPVLALPFVWFVAFLALTCGPEAIAAWFID